MARLADAIIVSGCDAAYFPLVDELHQSIIAANGGMAPPFGVIDAGLTAQQASSLREAGAYVVRPPAPSFVDPALLAARPALLANLSKPWLDVLFPGHDTLIWLDADTWVQDIAAIRLLRDAADTGAVAAVCDNGRFWGHQVDVRWLLGGIGGLCQVRSFYAKNGRLGGVPLRVLRDIGNRAQINAGVFALLATAPHWQAMRSWQERIIRHGGKLFSSDQLSLGLAVHADGLPVELLPETCNYIPIRKVDLSIPAIVETYYPYAKVGIVHLAGQKHLRFDPNATVKVIDVAGNQHDLSLRYGHFQRMAAARRPKQPAAASM